ncbi:uncharacterized protein BP5553_03812 [Venustampulla echinocandica]|uniref:Acyl-protein thioesterase 1 n=1 Tax=Venustampulla echinocandica TaxID=2656787 RepID=A0A370TVA4_9HELO|nr:uncharacterized protein BP5553_03812 [Venustampulla echinocandica]RDL39472.1 hypothetical protein BP5553_03812 [Venustampulla echinocandica]
MDASSEEAGDALSSDQPSSFPSTVIGPQDITKKKHGLPFLSIPPISTHTQTIILLHGRGSNGPRFGPPLVSPQLSCGNTLTQEFPGMKFIFPTAKKRRAMRFNRTPINQWFDVWSVDEPSEKEELQYDGICETSRLLNIIIQEEARVVGLRNVFLGGLSQGCAMGLHVFLNYLPENLSDDSFGGFIGMSGWLPLARPLQENVWSSTDAGDDDDPFAEPLEGSERGGETPQTWQIRAANFARDIADLPPLEMDTALPPFIKTPVFLSHGRHDEKVKMKLGEEARDVLVNLGLDVTWKDYEEGHWYKVPEQLDDIANFIRKRTVDVAKDRNS